MYVLKISDIISVGCCSRIAENWLELDYDYYVAIWSRSYYQKKFPVVGDNRIVADELIHN